MSSMPGRAQGVEQVFLETFDAAEPPVFPAGWVVENDAWETSASSASTGSGLNNAFTRGSSAGALITPEVDLSGAIAAELGYLARRTNSYDVANLTVLASIDGGQTYPIEVAPAGSALPSATSTYQSVTLPLPAALLNQPAVRFRFEVAGLSAASANARLDDVVITATRLVLVSPSHLEFLAMPGDVDSRVVALTNADASPLQVNAPMVGGSQFSVSPSGPVVIAAGETQKYTVTWAPVQAGSENRSLLLVHEHGTATISLEARTAGGILGFAADTSRVIPGDTLHEVDTHLVFDDPAGLQGLQFDVHWEEPALTLTRITPGDAIADSAAWTLSHQIDSVRATIVVLGSGRTALASGAYERFLSLEFAVPDTSEAPPATVISLQRAVGALSLPDGSDAGIALRPSSHVLLLDGGDATFVADPVDVTFPTVTVGDTAVASIFISNPGASIPLVIQSVETGTPTYSVIPDSVEIQPDSTVTVEVRFAPSVTHFGFQTASILFAHNGQAGIDSIQVSGIGEGGRGDVARDGVVDVVDLVQLIDLVLLRTDADSLQRTSGDVYPFPDGDAAFDVRDLTVLSHAIVNGFWPDSVALPVLPATTASPALLAAGEGASPGPISIDGTWTLAVDADVPLRALQVVLTGRGVKVVRPTNTVGKAAAVQILFSRSETEVRAVVYRTDGGLLEAGTYELLEIEPESDGSSLTPTYVIGVDAGLERVPVAVVGVKEGGAEREVPGDALRLGLPYPNPVRFSEDKRLRLPLAGRPGDSRSRAAVFNVLGQRVRSLNVPEGESAAIEWDGLDRSGQLVPPGLYFFRLEGGSGPVRSAIVVR